MGIAGLLPSAGAEGAALPIILWKAPQHIDTHYQAPYTALIPHS